MRRFIYSSLLVILLTACTTNSPDTPVTNDPGSSNPPVENPYAPRPGDDALARGGVYFDTEEILILESYPIQVSLHITGNLPDPCHKLRIVIGQPDEQNLIAVDVYSLADPMAMCIAVLEPFDVSLNLGNFPTGHYTVWVNGQQIGEFDS